MSLVVVQGPGALWHLEDLDGERVHATLCGIPFDSGEWPLIVGPEVRRGIYCGVCLFEAKRQHEGLTTEAARNSLSACGNLDESAGALIGPERSEGPPLARRRHTAPAGAEAGEEYATGDTSCKSPLSDPQNPAPERRGGGLDEVEGR